MHRYLPCLLVLFTFFVSYSLGADVLVEEDQHYWAEVAKDELEEALKVKWNTKKAKNIILFVGDGMGPNTVTASRILKGNEQTKLSFEQFPHMGLLKTYCVDKQVPDSASTASALFSGVKINFHTLGVDAKVKFQDCPASLLPENRIKSIFDWAQEAGKATGFVTNTRVTHATPAALYAHSADRKWECDSTMPPTANKCKDIGRQLVEELPGKNIKVIMGGGRQCLTSSFPISPSDPRDTWSCVRKDKRDLMATWIKDKQQRKVKYQLLNNTRDLFNLDTENTEFVMGIFANGHLAYDDVRNKSAYGMPTLKQMTSKAIQVLQKSPYGYVLVVESGLIDQAHHRGLAKRALNETLGLDNAIVEALKLVERQERSRRRNSFIYNDWMSNTLVIVTSDHAHGLTISGYPKRGNSIVGIAQNSPVDNIPYTTLGYATADGHAFVYTVHGNGTLVRRGDPSKKDINSFNYHQQAAILTEEVYHSGGDVAVYATGPMAHLFHNVHEQNFVAYVMAYAARIGPYSRKARGAAGSIHANKPHLFMLQCFGMILLRYILCR